MSGRCCLEQLKHAQYVFRNKDGYTTSCTCNTFWRRNSDFWRVVTNGDDDVDFPNIIYYKDIDSLIKAKSIKVGKYIKKLKKKGIIKDVNDIISCL